jgi:hypothetical protein
MKTPSKSIAFSLFFVLATSLTMLASNPAVGAKGPTSSSRASLARVQTYLGSYGIRASSVVPASDGSGNLLVTKTDGSHILVYVSGTDYTGFEITPN